MRLLVAMLGCAIAAVAQRKPITLDALNEWRGAAINRARQTPGEPVWAPDGKSFAYRQGNALRLYDVLARSSREIVSMNELSAAAVAPVKADRMQWENRRVGESAIQWFPAGEKLLAAAEGDLFTVDVRERKWKQLTRSAIAERDPKLSPDGKFVAFLRDWDIFTLDLGTGKETRLTLGGTETLRNGVPDWVYPEELNLGTAFWWSPDSTAIAYLQFDTSGEPLYPHADLRGEKAVAEPQRYPQAGDNNPAVRLGIVPLAGGKTRWLDIGETVKSQLITRAGWTPDSRSVFVVRTNRVQSMLEFVLFDARSGKSSVVYREDDPYWINIEGEPIFLDDSSGFLWSSERDGYRHLYRYGLHGEKPIQLTHGAWAVTGISCVDFMRQRIYYTWAHPTPLDRELESVSYKGGQVTSEDSVQLSATSGSHRVSMGPGCNYFLDTHSDLTSPPETTLRAADGSQLAVFRQADRSALADFEILPTDIVSFKSPDGTEFYGRLIKPAGFDPSKTYPVIVNVYGGPHAQEVRNVWPGMSLDQVFAQQGYVVWQMDNRGSYGRGHAFETPIFHKLGEVESADQRAGIEYLVSLGFADKNRIGVRGWSYGGFMTLNMLLRSPDLIRAGFAGAPVTSWKNYDTIYTERYMGLPGENQEGYRETALPRRASELQGALTIAHNFEDDNVLFQNTLQMIDALETAGKQFDLLLYTQKTHGVGGFAARQMEQAELDFFNRKLQPAASR